MAAIQSTRVLCIPPYYENHFELAVNRLASDQKYIHYQFFTIDRRYLPTTDLNLVLSMSRTIVHEEHIQMLVADSRVGQLIVAKLCQEFPQLRSGGMSFLATLQCLNRASMIDVFGTDQCVPTLPIEISSDWHENIPSIEKSFLDKAAPGYVKSVYGMDNQLSSVAFSGWETLIETIQTYTQLYEGQYMTNLLSLFRIYVPRSQFPSIFKPSYLLQPFFDLATYPHWRMVIASACVFDREIIMWPLVDGYSSWPFLADQPLAIMPIIVCPSRQLSVEQQSIVYARFRQHLNLLIANHQLQYGWIECSYFISCTNEVRLISMKPTYSVYLIEALKWTSEHGDPMLALVQVSDRQRPPSPILNGKTVYLHRLWAKSPQKHTISDLINMAEVKRIHRSTVCMNCNVRLRFVGSEPIIANEKKTFSELGFIQVHGEYHENGLANLIEFRSSLLKQPELVPFSHSSVLASDPNQFDPVTCLPSEQLLARLNEVRKQERKDLI